MLKIAIIVGVLVITALLIYAAMQPDEFRIQRSTTIKAPPEKIFVYLNDFEKAMAWSPYEKKDPNMKRTYSGTKNGKGSIYNFEGNNEVGSGRLEILDSIPDEKVVIQLDMYKPMKVSNIVEYILDPDGDKTKMTWAMRGNSPFLSKVVCLFLNMDKMVGTDFENGLADLKALAESSTGI